LKSFLDALFTVHRSAPLHFHKEKNMNVVLHNRNGFPVPLAFRSSTFEHPFERLVDSMFEDFVGNAGAGQAAATLTPRINVIESAEAFEVEAEVPGVGREDVRVSVEGKRISFDAEVRRDEQRKEGESLIHAERVVKKFTRSFSLPVEVDDSRAQARLENGILRLTLPKRQAVQAKQIAVQ
jgi:HSP20 family protein